MLCIDRFVLIFSWFLLVPPTTGLTDASPVLERHCGRNPPDTTNGFKRFQPRRDAKVETGRSRFGIQRWRPEGAGLSQWNIHITIEGELS